MSHMDSSPTKLAKLRQLDQLRELEAHVNNLKIQQEESIRNHKSQTMMIKSPRDKSENKPVSESGKSRRLANTLVFEGKSERVRESFSYSDALVE